MEDNTNNSAEKQLNFTNENFKTVGVDFEYDTLGDGFIKILPTDFIVEEVSILDEVITVDLKERSLPNERSQSGIKVGADLVKEGMSTLEASERIARALNISIENIIYSGIKDARALTSQEIIIRETTKEAVLGLKIAGIYLKNIHECKGIVKRGDLKGNRFTILVRTQDASEEKLQQKILEIKQHGFYNFYSLQRFGNRLMTHKVGEKILKQDYAGAVKMLLFKATEFDTGKINEVRRLAGELFDQNKFDEAFSLFEPYPKNFFYEMQLLKAYGEHGNYVRALKAVPDQARLCVQAYNSFWFNKLLSKKIAEGNVPETLPILSNYEENKKAYEEIIPKEEMDQLVLFQEPFERIVSWNNRFQVQTVITPKIYTVGKCKAGYIFVFELGKGAYATTFLANFFELNEFGIKPTWLSGEKMDTLKMLGRESVVEIERRLKPQTDDEFRQLTDQIND